MSDPNDVSLWTLNLERPFGLGGVAAARDVPNVNVHEITVGVWHRSAYPPIGGIFGNLGSVGFM
jgi:hypothetical protein